MSQPIQCTEEDLQELKRLALAVRTNSDDDDALGVALDEYDEHANPDQVLCLFEAIDRVTAERDALQQRLTAADEKNDTLSVAYLRAGEREHELRLRVGLLEGLLQRVVHASVLSFESGAPEQLESLEVDICAALKPDEGGGKSCACPGCDAPRRANSPFCAAHRSAKSRTRGQDPITADGLEWLMQNDGHQQ